MRLRADFWVAAYLRQAGVEGKFAALRQRGAAEAGAIYVLVDRLDGRVALYAPAPSAEGERRWLRAHAAEAIEPAEAETRLQKAMRFDPDIWIVELESPDGAHGLDIAED